MSIKYFFLISFLFCASSFASEPSTPVSVDSTTIKVNAKNKIIVYYLYVNPRCETCLNIEAFAKEAVDSSFADELKSGRIEWHAYDTDLPEYKHLWTDYNLEFKSLIIAEIVNGEQVRWKNCTAVWDLVGDKEAFTKFVVKEVQSYLNSE